MEFPLSLTDSTRARHTRDTRERLRTLANALRTLCGRFANALATIAGQQPRSGEASGVCWPSSTAPSSRKPNPKLLWPTASPSERGRQCDTQKPCHHISMLDISQAGRNTTFAEYLPRKGTKTPSWLNCRCHHVFISKFSEPLH